LERRESPISSHAHVTIPTSKCEPVCKYFARFGSGSGHKTQHSHKNEQRISMPDLVLDEMLDNYVALSNGIICTTNHMQILQFVSVCLSVCSPLTSYLFVCPGEIQIITFVMLGLN
jgi:hypothetical protein